MLETLWFATLLVIGITGGIIVERQEEKEKAKALYKKQWERKMRGTTLDVRFK